VIFMGFVIVNLVSAFDDSQLPQSCGGDNELIIGCLGDEELNFLGGILKVKVWTSFLKELKKPFLFI